MFGRYRVLSFIAEGGMGVVVRAEDEKLGRVVALKRLTAASIGAPESRRRLVAEARAAARLRHPNVVTIFEIHDDDEDGEIAISMDFIDGPSLRQRLRDGPSSPVDAATMVRQVAHALDTAHRAGLVHRDVKPENVLFAPDGSAVLCDFGIVKDLAPPADGDGFRTDLDAVPGTPPYVAPELVGQGRTEPASDQFSLAVTTFEALTGVLPWGRGAPLEGHQVFAAILMDPIPAAHELRAELPPEASAVLSRATAKSPDDRYADCTAFANDLAVALGVADAAAAPVWTTPASNPTPRPAGAGEAPETTAPMAPTGSGGAKPPPGPGPTTPARSGSYPFPPLALRPWLVWGGIALALGMIVFVARSGPRAFTTGGPLAATVACPVLDARLPDGSPAPWIGAAVANQACRRIAIRLGGRPDNVRPPSQLLEAEVGPSLSVAVDPYRSPKVVASSHDAAESYDFVVDGSAGLSPTGDFEVTLALRRGGRSRPFASAEATHRGLAFAVERALRVLEREGHLSRAPLDPDIAAVETWRDVAAALTAEDLSFAIRAGFEAPRLCEDARLRANELGAWVSTFRTVCETWRIRGGLDPDASWPEPSVPERPAGRLSILASSPECDEACISELDRLLEGEDDDYVEAVLAAARGGAAQFRGDDDLARALGARAVQATPSHEAGHSVRTGVSHLSPAAVTDYLLWFPDRTDAHHMHAQWALDTGSEATLSSALRRAYQIGWANGFHGLRYVDHLFATGRDNEAEAAAVRFQSGPDWLRLAGTYVSARAELRRGRLAEAPGCLFQALLDVERFGYGEQFGDMEALELYRRALIEVQERPDDAQLTRLVTHLLGDPAHLRTNQQYWMLPVLSLCAWTTGEPARACVERLERQPMRDAVYPAVSSCYDGLLHWVAGEVDEAAQVWWAASLNDKDGAYLLCDVPSPVFDSMAERQTDPGTRDDWLDRAQALDRKRAGQEDFNGVDPALARMAARAHRRGLLARDEGRPEDAAAFCRDATTWARQIVEAWNPTVLDLRLPAVPRMRAILASCADGVPDASDVDARVPSP